MTLKMAKSLNFSDDGSLNGSNLSKSFEFLEKNKTLISETKLAQLKQALAEANDAYAEYKTSEILLEVCKKTRRTIPANISKKLSDIELTHKAQRLIKMKSKDGKAYNLFGLEESDLETRNSKLSTLEKSVIESKVLNEVKSTIKQLSREKQSLKDKFGEHCIKVMSKDTIVPTKQIELLNKFQSVGDQLQEASDLLEANAQLIQEHVGCLQSPESNMKLALHSKVLDQAKYLHNKISAINLKIQQHSQDKIYSKAVEEVGQDLQKSLSEIKEKHKKLQKDLAKYEEKERSSGTYKEIIREYDSIKKQLCASIQTLKMINEAKPTKYNTT